MNCLLATVIDSARAVRGCDAALRTQVKGSKPAGMPVSVAYAHDLGRERHDTNLSGEGPG
ncbi:hypothetical protein ACG02S_01510 [Roseateles sp. DC23W]|uniref:Uncharacterized protein n=1 Tax=Pelomonas dachongensis TaxID=3299029 RepID=A0ABW7EIQ5_9BURK